MLRGAFREGSALKPIVVTIPGPPCPQGRGRAVRFGEKIRVIDPAKSRSWKGVAQVHMQKAMAGRPPMIEPLAVYVLASFALPASQHRKSKHRLRSWHTLQMAEPESPSRTYPGEE